MRASLVAPILLLALAGLPAGPATYQSVEQALEAAEGFTAQATEIEAMASGGQLAQLQSQGLATREAALQRASELRRQAVVIYEDHGQPEDASIQLSAIAANSRELGLLDLALQDLRQAALIDLGMNRTDWIIIDLRDLAAIFAERNLVVEQMLALREIVRLGELRGARRDAALALAQLSGIAWARRNFEMAAADAAHAVELARPLGDPAMLVNHLWALGRAQRELGDGAAARQALGEALALDPTPAQRGDLLNQLALLDAAEGDLDSALVHWREVVALDQQANATTWLRGAWQAMIDACLAAGRPRDAVAASQERLDMSRQHAQETNWRTVFAGDLAAHGAILIEAGDPARARAALTEALSVYQPLGSRQGEARTRLDLAEAALALGQPEQALQDLATVTPQFYTEPEVQRRAALLTARAMQAQRRYPEAQQQLDAALQAAQSVGDDEGEIEVLRAGADLWRAGQNQVRLTGALSRLGGALTAAGRDEEALPVYEELMAIYEITQQLQGWSYDLTEFARLRERQGELDAAIALVEQAVTIDERLANPASQAIDQADLARLRLAAGDSEGAVAAARAIVAIGEASGNVDYRIEGLERVAHVQRQSSGEASAEAAAATLAEALEIAAAAGKTEAQTRILSTLVELAAERGDWTAAERHAREALALDEQSGNASYQVVDHCDLAVAIANQGGRDAEALQHADRAVTLAAGARDLYAIAAQVNRGTLRLRLGQGAAGVADLQGVLPVLRDRREWGLAATALALVAEHQRGQGQLDLAIDSLVEAIDLDDNAVSRAPLMPSRFIAARVAREDLYDALISLLNGQGRVVEALEYTVRLDGRQLSEENLQMALGGGAGLRSDAASEETAEPESATRSATPPPLPSAAETTALPSLPAPREESVGQGDWASLLSGMSAQDQQAFEITPMNVPFILRHLPDDQTLFILYHLGSTCRAYYGALDQPMQAVELTVTRETIEEQVGEFRRLVRDADDALEDQARGRMSAQEYAVFSGRLEERANDLLRQLYRGLVQPLESAVPHYADYKTVLLYPSGVLRVLPFGALIRERPDGRREHWIESREIVYFPCGASEIAQEHMEAPVRRLRGRMLVLAWPGSRAERNYIENVLEEEQGLRGLWTQARGESNYTALREDEATLANLLTELSGEACPQILHLATHGNLRPGSPQDSYISLAGGERLRIDDLWSLPLANTRMAVLSMCNAEYNPDGPADALGTFARAIYIAGCPSVVASLWRVRDEAAEMMMTDFYENLLSDGMSRIAALTGAQRAMIATRGTERDFSHPFNWAPFVLIGEWR